MGVRGREGIGTGGRREEQWKRDGGTEINSRNEGRRKGKKQGGEKAVARDSQRPGVWGGPRGPQPEERHRPRKMHGNSNNRKRRKSIK